jgi:hypothetical protein
MAVVYQADGEGETLAAVILRCSPFFTASLEGWATDKRPSFETRARRAPQDDVEHVLCIPEHCPKAPEMPCRPAPRGGCERHEQPTAVSNFT